MDPLTISALIGLAPTLLGMDWDQIFNGNKYSSEGWHGWSSAKKDAFVLETTQIAYTYAMSKEYEGYTPQQIFFTILGPYIFRPDSKTFDGWFSKNKQYQAVFDEAAKKYGFKFNEKAPKAAVLKNQFGDILKNPMVLYGALALVGIWIVSIVVKIVKK